MAGNVAGNSHASYVKIFSVKFPLEPKQNQYSYKLTIKISKGINVYKTTMSFSYKSSWDIIMKRTMNISQKIHNIHSKRKSANATAIFFLFFIRKARILISTVLHGKFLRKERKANVAIVVSTRVDSFCVIKMINFGFLHLWIVKYCSSFR